MSLWGLVISTVGFYNIIKGIYSMYCDADGIKNQYRLHQKVINDYKQTQNYKKQNRLTESQYHLYEHEFVLLNESQILDPYR